MIERHGKSASRGYRKKHLVKASRQRYSAVEVDGYLQSPAIFRRYRLLTHLVLCPTRSSDGRPITDTNIAELREQAQGLEARLKLKASRSVRVYQMDYDRPSLFFRSVAACADKIYVVGHCNGETFGSKNSGIIDFNPDELADWLIASTLMRPGITVKIMACYSASIIKPGHVPFAERVARALAAKGCKGITVRGYDGRTKEFRLNGRLRSVCTPMWSHAPARGRDDEADAVEEGEVTVPVRASKTAHDFRV